MMMDVVICGFGQIGRMLFRHWAGSELFRVVGVIDADPELAGREVDALAGVETGCDLKVVSAVKDCVRGQVAVVTTVSAAEAAAPVILELAAAGMSVVTTCEELSWPYRRHPELARCLDGAAREAGVAILATGINPGFLMDLVPVMLSAASSRIEHVLVERIQDASPRRMQFQRKIGAGLTPEEFRAREAAGTLRHVGLPESVDFIASALGWDLAEVTEELQPVMAECDVNIPGAIPVRAGEARGVRQIGRGIAADGRTVITLEFVAAIGEPEPCDRVTIRGVPAIESTIRGGVNGDQGTCAMVSATVRRLGRGGFTGFMTMLDLPPAGGCGA